MLAEWTAREAASRPSRPGRLTDVVDSLGDAAFFAGEPERAMTLHEDLAARRALGDRWGVAMSLLSLGWMALGRGDAPRAEALLEESLAAENAARLLGAADAIHESLGTSKAATVWSRHTDPHLRAARARLGPDACPVDVAVGRRVEP